MTRNTRYALYGLGAVAVGAAVWWAMRQRQSAGAPSTAPANATRDPKEPPVVGSKDAATEFDPGKLVDRLPPKQADERPRFGPRLVR